MLFLGFSAGIPLLLIFSSLSLWLREAGAVRESGHARQAMYRVPTDRLVPLLRDLIQAEGGRLATVTGIDVRDGLFGDANPINKKMKIGRTVFRVVGVMEKQGGSFMGGPNFDRRIFIPVSSYVKQFGGSLGRQNVDVAVKAPSMVVGTTLRPVDSTIKGCLRPVKYR